MLGSGIVAGSVILLGGEPGIGKSTLLLQLAQLAAAQGRSVLYVTGEESSHQIRLRADRLGHTSANLAVLASTDVDDVVAAVESQAPELTVVDSIQTMQTTDLDSAAGSLGQVRESAARLVRLAKETHVPIILVGHVTKDGSIAGPKVLEHMVDVVTYLEGEPFQTFRLLRANKNRFGPSHEIGVFEMRDSGLVDVANPSALFLTEAAPGYSGASLAVTMEGNRPLVVEIQALVNRTVFGLPRRSANGIDLNRLSMLGAVLMRRGGVDISAQDVYVNVVGGLRINEPAVDLAVIAAIFSSARDLLLGRTAFIGEVGLGGEVRPVSGLERRIDEAIKLGLTGAVVPARGSNGKPGNGSIRIAAVKTVSEALELCAVPTCS